MVLGMGVLNVTLTTMSKRDEQNERALYNSIKALKEIYIFCLGHGGTAPD